MKPIAATLALALPACSGTSLASMTPQMRNAAASPLSGKNEKVFVTGSSPSAIYVMNVKGHIEATATADLDAPQGLATDASGKLYVANTGGGNILVFSPPYTGTPSVLADEAGATPLDVAVDPSGNLAVTNLARAQGTGDVAFYKAGATSPTSTVHSPRFEEPRFCAFDRDGNLFLDNLQQTAPANTAHYITLGEIRGGIAGKSIARLKTSSGIFIDNNGAGSVQVNVDGKLSLDDFVTAGSQGGNINTYDAAKGRNLGTPSVLHLAQSVQPSTFAFLPGGKRFLTADNSLDAVLFYTYPEGKLLATFDMPQYQLIGGIATYPTEQY